MAHRDSLQKRDLVYLYLVNSNDNLTMAGGKRIGTRTRVTGEKRRKLNRLAAQKYRAKKLLAKTIDTPTAVQVNYEVSDQKNLILADNQEAKRTVHLHRASDPKA